MNTKLFQVFALLLVFAVAIGIAVPSRAQTTNGAVAGVVSDPSGAVVTSAKVTLTSLDTGESRTTTTNGVGAYRFDAIPAGNYKLSVEAQSFSTTTVAKLIVNATVVTAANVTLSASASETVEVNASAQTVQTENGEISHNITSVEVTQIPILNLNAYSLALTEPGVVAVASRDDFTNGTSFSVNGTRPRANNFLIEGQDNNDAGIQGQGLQPGNVDAVKEVTVLTNSYSAEFGHGGGSVSNLVYKSGTNQFHGALWDRISNSALDSNSAENKLNGTPKDSSRENVFGFDFGGPIKKNKLFFFGSYQWDKFRSSASGGNLLLPTANGVATLQSLGPNPRIQNLLTAMGPLRGVSNPSIISLGNGRPGVEVGTVQRSGISNDSDSPELDLKGDYLVTSKDTIGLRYIRTRFSTPYDALNFPNQLPGFDALQDGTSHNAGITYTHVFSPSLLNEFRVSYGRIGFTFDLTPQAKANPLTQLPTTTISGLTLVNFGAISGNPQGRFHNTFQYQDSLSWSKGSHSFKFGADIARIDVRDAIPFNFFGTMSYSAGGGFSGLANYIDDFGGKGGAVAITYGSPIVRPRYLSQNYFALDEWKLKPNLTITYGLRYENNGSPQNVLKYPAVSLAKGGAADPNYPERIEQKSQNDNFAPRFSFAYSPHLLRALTGDGKTVLRGGFGVFYDGLFTNIIDNGAASSPNAISPSRTSTTSAANPRGLPNFSAVFARLSPTLNPLASVSSIIDDLKTPTTLQWNFDIQRELPANFVFIASYVGTRGERLYANDQLNPVDPNSPTGLRLVPTRGSVQIRDNSGDSIYHGLDLKLDRRFANGLLFRTAYTWSKAIDDASEVFVTSGLSSFPADLTLGHRRIDRGLSVFDRRHRVVVTTVYQPPVLSAHNFAESILGNIVNHWTLAGTFAYQTGAPETVSDGFDANGDGQAADRPNLGNPAAPIATYALDGSFIGAATGTLCSGPTAFNVGTCTPVSADSVHWIIPASGNGNVGRNTIETRGRQDTTVAIARTFPIRERESFEFRSEMFNPFNHPNTGIPSYNLANIPTSGVVRFANYPLTVTGNRTIRFLLKFAF